MRIEKKKLEDEALEQVSGGAGVKDYKLAGALPIIEDVELTSSDDAPIPDIDSPLAPKKMIDKLES